VKDNGDNSDTYVPPFEMYPMSISSGVNKDHIYTCTIRIKMNVKHHGLLHELFTHLFHNLPIDVAQIQFSLSGISMPIGLDNYQKLILYNNKYFSSVATIPISGITLHVLELEIHVTDESNPDKHQPLWHILQSLPWHNHIEHKQMDNKILVVTTKGQLSSAQQWLDQNFEPLFNKHLPKNPHFKEVHDNTKLTCFL